MQSSSWQRILKIFYEYSVEILIYIINGRFQGVIAKQDIVEALSDIAVIDSVQEDIPVREVESIETLLELHQKFHCTDQEGNKVLPVINKKKDFVGLWGRAEIVKAFESLPAISSWQPQQISKQEQIISSPIEKTIDIKALTEELQNTPLVESSSPLKIILEKNKEKEQLTEDLLKPKITLSQPEDEPKKDGQNDAESPKSSIKIKSQSEISIAKETKPLAQPFENDESISKPTPLWKTELEKAKLAVLTIETLPIPLMAADPSGNELYFNKDWENLVKVHRHQLNTGYLVAFAKDIMADMALKGELDPSDTLSLKVLKKVNLQMRLIREEHQGHTQPVGYLFFANEHAAQRRDEKINIATQEQSFTAFEKLAKKPSLEKDAESFLGRALPDIIADQEKKAIEWALDETGGIQSNAAMLLGIPRQTFSYKVQKHAIKVIT